jgi:hypothetical protein
LKNSSLWISCGSDKKHKICCHKKYIVHTVQELEKMGMLKKS